MHINYKQQICDSDNHDINKLKIHAIMFSRNYDWNNSTLEKRAAWPI